MEEQLVCIEGQGAVHLQGQRGHRGGGDGARAGVAVGASFRCEYCRCVTNPIRLYNTSIKSVQLGTMFVVCRKMHYTVVCDSMLRERSSITSARWGGSICNIIINQATPLKCCAMSSDGARNWLITHTHM